MPQLPVATKNLIIITALCYLATLALPRVGLDMVKLFGLHFPGAKDFKVWQIVSYMFMHGSFTHLFFNMFAIYMFGRVLEEVWGLKRFLVFYFITGIGAAIIQILTWVRYVHTFAVNHGTTLGTVVSSDPSLNYMITIGASGAVFGILLAFGMMFPNTPLYIMFIPIPIKAKYVVAGYGVIELISGLVHVEGDVVAHFAHLGGMLFGYILLVWWKRSGSYKRW
ncbi:MAG: rhomboid family intramembrane serine protease [Tannerellaceae bacterium]|jgi:membrane associated rhomboid family serine protease|nr:rhomboid family intramembrane serine protease [Tannerellaceae bacterium]